MYALKPGVEWRGDAVAFGVEIVADFQRVARLALVVIVVHRRLQQERVFALRVPDSLNSLLCRCDQHVRVRLHEFPHLLVDRDIRRLDDTDTGGIIANSNTSSLLR